MIKRLVEQTIKQFIVKTLKHLNGKTSK